MPAARSTLSASCTGSCSLAGPEPGDWCAACWHERAVRWELITSIRLYPECWCRAGVVEGGEGQRQRDWVEMMTERRRQQAEEARGRREEVRLSHSQRQQDLINLLQEAARRREEEASKKDEAVRKKEEEKKRREVRTFFL